MAKPYLRRGMYYSNFRAGTKRVRKALSPNKRDAQRMLDEMVFAVRAHKNGVFPQHLRFGTFEDRYLEFSATDKKPNTLYRDKRAFHLMKTYLPIVYLTDVTPELLERLKYKWQGEITPSVVTRSIKAIKTAMRKAEGWGYIARQDWATVKVKEPQGRLLYYSVPELEQLIAASAGIYRIAIIIMARSGLRSGEVYHLEVSDLRFDLEKIHVGWKECGMRCPGCESGRWSPKWRKERWVPMSRDLKDYLSGLRLPQGRVLQANPIMLQPFLANFADLIEKCGLPGSPHTLRHTFASHAVSHGASLESIKEILGHASIRTTEKYAHLLPHVSEDAVNKLPVVRLGYNQTSASGTK